MSESTRKFFWLLALAVIILLFVAFAVPRAQGAERQHQGQSHGQQHYAPRGGGHSGNHGSYRGDNRGGRRGGALPRSGEGYRGPYRDHYRRGYRPSPYFYGGYRNYYQRSPECGYWQSGFYTTDDYGDPIFIRGYWQPTLCYRPW